jgi:hypothetical protein
VYTQILDIGEYDDVTFTIPYHQPEGWKTIDRGINTNWTPGNSLAPRGENDNGTLTIRVLNTLTAPATSSVSLLFFVSGGDNFEYAAPATSLGTTDGGYPMMFNLQGEDTTDVVPTEMIIGTQAAVLPERYGVNMGECVASLRSLLHRQTLYSTRAATDSLTGSLIFNTALKRLPASPGFDSSAFVNATKIVAASGVSPFNYVNMTPLTWVTTAFCGYRGSTNYTITPCANGTPSVDRVNVFRSTNATDASVLAYLSLITTVTATTNGSKLPQQNYWSTARTDGVEGSGGAAITATRTNGSVMFNFPNYNKNNFARADPTLLYLGTSLDDTRNENVGVELWLDSTVTPASRFSLSIYTGAGPDFNPVFFLCCPTIDYTLVPIY